MMDENIRDTKFLGFAKLVVEDIEGLHLWIEEVDAFEAIQDIIAQRAYDLAVHLLTHSPRGTMYAALGTPEEAHDIIALLPDLTEWPPTE